MGVYEKKLRMKASTLLGFALCSLFVAVSKAKVVVPANECGGSWTSGGNGNCYFLMSYFEYFQSRLECQEMCIWSLGGKLGSIHSDEEQELIVNMIQNSGVVGHKTWTGGDCNDSSGEWGWDDESAWDYERWATNGGTKWMRLYVSGY